MKIRFFLVFFFSCVLCISTSGLSLNQEEKIFSSSTSVIIPCHIGHFWRLENLLQKYKSQTVLPDEVVISVSNVGLLSEEIKETILGNHWPFKIKLILHQESRSASENRNIASDNSTGNILIYQDADDFPHPRRIEVIKYFFEVLQIDHLMHQYVFENGDFLNFEKIELLQWFIPSLHHPNLGCNPGVAITRKVFNEIRWPEEISHGEDCFFNNMVYQKFSKRIVLKFPLYMYNRRNPPPGISVPYFLDEL